MTPEEQAQILLGSTAAYIWSQDLLRRLLPKLPLFLDEGKKPQFLGRISHMEELIGRTITAIWMEPDNSRIVFETAQGPLAYAVEGDCCSYSWFNDILGVDALLDATVAAVEEVSLPDVDTDTTDACVQAYGLKLTTDRGYAEVIFRNVSNGYYGGSCASSPDNDIDPDMTRITDDWTADA